MYNNHLAMLIGNSLGKGKPACLASVHACATVCLRLRRACSSCSRAGAVHAGKPSTLGDEVGLIKEPTWGLVEGPAGQGV
jgi:hypothetical protein